VTEPSWLVALITWAELADRGTLTDVLPSWALAMTSQVTFDGSRIVTEPSWLDAARSWGATQQRASMLPRPVLSDARWAASQVTVMFPWLVCAVTRPDTPARRMFPRSVVAVTRTREGPLSCRQTWQF